MTTDLPYFTLRRVRELSSVEVKILLVLLLVAQPLGTGKIAMWAGCDEKTARKALHYLSSPEVQLVARTTYRDGWQIVRVAFQLPLSAPDPDQPQSYPEIASSASGLDQPPSSWSAPLRQAGNSPASSGNFSRFEEGGVVVDLDPGSDLLDPPPPPPGRNGKFSRFEVDEQARRADVAEACRRAGIGYKKRREIVEQPNVRPDWIARTIRQLDLENRLGLAQWESVIGYAIYRLVSGLEPMTVEAMDALEAEAERSAQAEIIEREHENQFVAVPAPAVDPEPPDPSLEQPVTPGGSMKPGQVWQAVLGELSLQMSKPTFDTWVKPSWVIRYANGQFVIAVTSEHIKDWLENRLLSSIERSLVGVMNRPVDIEFVVRNP